MVTITLTFDNLGEATTLERGTWRNEASLGAHPSVMVALPRLLDELDRHALRATFCVEAINCELYPRAIQDLAGRGHELALHGWRHEPWSELAIDHEREILQRSRAAFAGLGLTPIGFRPPGGDPSPHDPALLAEHGLAWWSPALAEGNAEPDLMSGTDVRCVPFSWDLVDAYLLMESFAERRVRRGDPPATLEPAEAGGRLRARVTSGSGPHTLVLHPFLMLEEAWWGEVRGLLAAVAELVASGQAVCRPAGETPSADVATRPRPAAPPG